MLIIITVSYIVVRCDIHTFAAPSRFENLIFDSLPYTCHFGVFVTYIFQMIHWIF
jgi:hypothetical protein